MYHYTFYTNKSVSNLIADLMKTLMSQSFSILWQFELHQKLEEKDFSPKRRQTILEVCDPDDAASILGINPLISYFLPCKIVITEKNGQVSVGMVKPTVLILLTNDQEALVMAKDIEAKLVKAINEAL